MKITFFGKELDVQDHLIEWYTNYLADKNEAYVRKVRTTTESAIRAGFRWETHFAELYAANQRLAEIQRETRLSKQGRIADGKWVK